MNRHKTIAVAEILAGIFGLAACISLYFIYGERISRAVARMDRVADDARIQAQIGEELLDEWSGLMGGMEKALSAHERSLQTLRGTSDQVANSVGQWQSGLQGFERVSRDAQNVCSKFAKQLPIRVPIVTMDTREVAFELPRIELKDQTVQLPYPTARVGTRRVDVDLGLTDVSLDIPTLELGTRNRSIKMPLSPELSKSTERITVPDNVQISQREFLADEKQLLSETADQLGKTANLLAQATGTLDSVHSLMTHELVDSIDATKSSISDSRSSIHQTRTVRIPEFQRRLASERHTLELSQTEFRSLQSLIPWLFVFAGMIPLGLLGQGIYCWPSALPNALKDSTL